MIRDRKNRGMKMIVEWKWYGTKILGEQKLLGNENDREQ